MKCIQSFSGIWYKSSSETTTQNKQPYNKKKQQPAIQLKWQSFHTLQLSFISIQNNQNVGYPYILRVHLETPSMISYQVWRRVFTLNGNHFEESTWSPPPLLFFLLARINWLQKVSAASPLAAAELYNTTQRDANCWRRGQQWALLHITFMFQLLLSTFLGQQPFLCRRKTTWQTLPSNPTEEAAGLW